MKKIDKLVLGRFIGPFILTFFITLFIIVMQFLWKYIDDLVGKGLEWQIIAELIFYASASFVPLALPLAVLLSSIMTMGSFGENYELVAAKSSGISLVRFLAPLIAAVVLISTGAFFFSNNLLPQANLKMYTLLYDVRHQKPALNIKEGIFYNEIEGYSIKVGNKEPDNKTIEDIIVYDHTSGKGNDNVLIAERGEMFTTADGRFMVLRLINGRQYSEMKPQTSQNNYEHLRTDFKKWEKYFDLSQFALQRTDEKFWRNHYEMLSLRQLRIKIDSMKSQLNEKEEGFAASLNEHYSSIRLFSMMDSGKAFDTRLLTDFNSLRANEKSEVLKRALNSARSVKSLAGIADRDIKYKKRSLVRHELTWHRRFTFSAACIVLFFIGAPLGAIIRIGGLGMPLVISVLFFVVFHVLTMSGQKIAEEGVFSAAQGSWLATSLLLPIGIFLTYKSMRDSSLLNLDWYYSVVNRLIQKTSE
ncbi:MAG TPA: LptF/LptG family permease [Chitinophagales bacterium]|nr:LptF/LptG family permease [Chitinophagales bacterium]